MDTKPLQHTPEYIALCEEVKGRITEIAGDEVQNLLAKGEECVLVDVRDPDEFAECCIPGAQAMSKGWIEAKIHNIAPDKGAKIILYCGSGNRSALAADNLQKMGYTNVLSMAGGIKGWIKSGKAVEER